MLGFGVIVTLVLLVLLFTDPISFFVIVLLLATLGFILFYFGFIQIKKKQNELDITYTTVPTPEGTPSESSALPSSEIKPRSLGGPEVFHIADNVFTYDEARAVCKAYNAELASYSQIEQAYNSGAEWCGYGWSEGSLALFPTQESTWEKLQKEQDPAKRIECGRPGINGGYFDASTKFGVNCYGVKPTQKISDAKQMAAEDASFKRLVGQIQDRVDKLLVSPFNAREWSGASISYSPMVSAQPPEPTREDIDILENVVSGVQNVVNQITNVVKSII
jgi:hypothetical protein